MTFSSAYTAPISQSEAFDICWSRNVTAQNLLSDRLPKGQRQSLTCRTCQKLADGLYSAARWFEQRAASIDNSAAVRAA